MKKAATETINSGKKSRPPSSPEAREAVMISLATDLAEQQLRDGTASSQVITHFLKLGTARERIEKEILEKQKNLIEAKTEQLQATKKSEEMFAEAIDAMKRYSGNGRYEEDE